VVLAVAGAVILFFLKPHGAKLVELELAADAAAFEQQLTSGWVKTCDVSPSCEQGQAIPLLRSNAFVDSILFVPGYAGLLVFFTLALGSANGVRRRAVLGQLLCVLPVATAFFDIVENGMTVRAADDWLIMLLSDGVVADVRLASLSKWGLSAASFAVVGVMALRAALVRTSQAAGDAPTGAGRVAGRIPLLVGGAASLVAAGLFALGVLGRHSMLELGMGASLVAFVALIAWQPPFGPARRA